MNFDISVVIATLGGGSLEATISQLNSGSIVPKEIIVSLPEGYKASFNGSIPTNVKVVISPEKGQVAQRCFGFKISKSLYVLQLDDDVFVDKNCLELLLSFIVKAEYPLVVAPSGFNKSTGQFAYRIPNLRDRLLAFVANGSDGSQYGKISKSGINFGYKYNENEEVTEVEWLNGGCVLHKRDHLIFDNFYPFSGKAYAEDLYHCMRLRENGIRLYISSTAKIYFEWLDQPETFLSAVKFFVRSLKAMFEYARLDNRSRFRLIFYYIASIITLPFKKN